MMLLIGMKISFTKNPTNPITTNPMAVRTATFENSSWHHPDKKKKSRRAMQGVRNGQIEKPEAPIPKMDGSSPERWTQRNGNVDGGVTWNYPCGRACGSAWRGARYPWRTPSGDRRRNQPRPCGILDWGPGGGRNLRNPSEMREERSPDFLQNLASSSLVGPLPETCSINEVPPG